MGTSFKRDNLFPGLKNLDSLGLAHNKLRQVPPRVFSHLGLLNSLELDGNNIDKIDPEAFSGLEGEFSYLVLYYFQCEVHNSQTDPSILILTNVTSILSLLLLIYENKILNFIKPKQI